MNNIEELINNAMLSSLEGYAFLVADSIEFELNRKLTTTEHQQVFVAVEHVASGNSALLTKLEAAEKELFDLHNQEFQQRLANAEHQLYMKDLAIHNIKASRKAQFRKRKALETENAELKQRAEAAEARLLVPVTFDELADAVKHVTGGIRIEFDPKYDKGHHAVPFMNFNSLSRIVEMFRAAGYPVEGGE
ncbi:hypothetical protein [Yersinia alsatica]|uniref:hypothetical protein n=1 Tax=Yersinia alsatica TaxID=2890317 RepID=UPI0011A9EA4F|nr:hypothetical protein [Yersinia alsatica]